MAPFCAAVDWGTSSFRLWLLDSSGRVLAERRSDDGLLKCVPGRFAEVLESHLAQIGADDSLPVVICGMAGSRQGWIEAPYRTVPVRINEPVAGAVRIDGVLRDIRILPGLAQRDPNAADVMRGEETQILGAVGDSRDRIVACLPGSHSKWVEIDQGQVRRFTTYMTGELYAAISGHTILAHAGGKSPTSRDSAAFAQAVRRALAAPESLTASLFGARGRELLGYAEPSSSHSAISGLLVGHEIAASRKAGLADGMVLLIASGELAERYGAAFEAAGIAFVMADADRSVITGLFRAAQQMFMPAGQGRTERAS